MALYIILSFLTMAAIVYQEKVNNCLKNYLLPRQTRLTRLVRFSLLLESIL